MPNCLTFWYLYLISWDKFDQSKDCARNMRACCMQVKLTHLYMLHINIQVILGADFIFEVKNTFFGIFPHPSWPAKVCARMCCAGNARVEGQMFILTLKMRSATSINYEKTLSLVKNFPGWPSWMRTRAHTLGAGQSVRTVFLMAKNVYSNILKLIVKSINN